MTELVTSGVAPFVPPSPRTSIETIAADVLAPVHAAPARVSAGRTPRPRWAMPLRALVDALLVLTSAAVLAGLGAPAPLPVVSVAVVAWPLLLVALGARSAGPVDRTFGGNLPGVGRAVGVAAPACWLLVPLAGAPTSPGDVVPLLALLAATTAASTALFPLARPLRVVLAGAATDVAAALDELGPSPRFDVVGVCLPPQRDDLPGQEPLPLDAIPLSVGLTDSVDMAAGWHADAVLLLPGADLPHRLVRRLLWRAAACDLDAYVATGMLDVAPRRMSVVQGMGLDLLHVRPAPTRGVRRLVKEVFERTAALLGLLVLSPALLVVGAMIRRESPGPALFRQQRVGQDGQAFTMYKFRTMRQTAEVEREHLVDRNECDAVLFKMRSDPRITPLGARLRRYSIDEVPQLLNVVTGHMSLVGPRPALPDEVEKYDHDPRRRLAVKPGLTGLWQVSGRSDLTWEESVRLDVRYVDNWSLTLDATILVRTIRAVVSHDGAY